MMLAQRLYEGVAVGGRGAVGLITYMRTDSTRFSTEAIDMIRAYVKNRYGSDFLPESPNVFKNKKSAQEAHEAIRPTDVELEPASIKNTSKRICFVCTILSGPGPSLVRWSLQFWILPSSILDRGNTFFEVTVQ